MKNELGIFLENLRGKMSLRKASEKSGLSHTYIRDLELGINRSTRAPIKPTPETLKRLSEAYNFPYEELMEKSGYIEYSKIDKLIENSPEGMKELLKSKENLERNLQLGVDFMVELLEKDDSGLAVIIELMEKEGYEDEVIQMFVNDRNLGNIRKYYSGISLEGRIEFFQLLYEWLESNGLRISDYIKERDNPDFITYNLNLDENSRRLLDKYNSLSDKKKKMLEGMLDLLDSGDD